MIGLVRGIWFSMMELIVREVCCYILLFYSLRLILCYYFWAVLGGLVFAELRFWVFFEFEFQVY